MFFYMDGWIDSFFRFCFKVVSFAFDDANTPLGYIFSSIEFIVIVSVGVAMLVAPITLPFNRRDLRKLCVMLLIVDLVILIFGNIYLIVSTESIFFLFSLVYSIIWLVWVWLMLEMNDIDMLIDSSQAEPVVSVFAAAMSISVVYISIVYLLVDWVLAYMYGAILVSTLFNIGHEIYLDSRYNKRL
tara:strand:- start:147 stop:704 length:558 start_codon:yes stop_codon:yes gene_type:complete